MTMPRMVFWCRSTSMRSMKPRRIWCLVMGSAICNAVWMAAVIWAIWLWSRMGGSGGSDSRMAIWAMISFSWCSRVVSFSTR